MTEAQHQIIRFLATGLASTGLYFALLVILIPFVPSVIFLTAICYIISMGANFMAQAFFTFEVKRLSAKQLRRYVTMHGSAMLINSAAMSILVNNFHIQFFASQVLVTGFITILTFTVSKSWVYR